MNANDEGYGAQWLRSWGKTLSPEGERVANLVNWWLAGIYHEESSVLKVDWSKRYVELVLYAKHGRFATFDSNQLTRLVVGAHDAAIRVQLESASPQHIRLIFHPRSDRTGHMFERHPLMEAVLDSMQRLPRFEGVPVEVAS